MSDTITKIQAPAIKTNGQSNGTATRTNNLPRNLNNNNVAATANSDFFVADFSTAVIFNGATFNSNNNNNNNASSKVTKTATAQNGTNSNENSNFADFDHNPIFNAGNFLMWIHF